MEKLPHAEGIDTIRLRVPTSFIFIILSTLGLMRLRNI